MGRLNNRSFSRSGRHPLRAEIVRDLDRLEEVEIEKHDTRFLLRTEAHGVAGKVFQAVGIALSPTLRKVI